MQVTIMAKRISKSSLLGRCRFGLERRARHWDVKTQEINLDNQLEWVFSTANINHTLLAGIDYKRVRKDLDNYMGLP